MWMNVKPILGGETLQCEAHPVVSRTDDDSTGSVMTSASCGIVALMNFMSAAVSWFRMARSLGRGE